MSVIYLLFGLLVLGVTFAIGYNYALRTESKYYQQLGEEQDSLEPIFDKLDREYKYTDKLAKPFSDDK